MKLLASRTTLIAGVLLIAATNAVVLSGAAYNRSGEPEAVLKITQREAVITSERGARRENSGVSLSLQYRTITRLPSNRELNFYDFMNYGHGEAEWLDRSKLAGLGFDMTVRGHAPSEIRRYGKQLPKPAVLVLELDGEAYRTSLKRLEQFAARDRKPATDTALLKERHENSRLFIVDAGLDADALRKKYPDRGRYALVHGKVSLREWGEGAGGYLEVPGGAVNVPLQFQDAIGPVAKFEAALAFGQRLEPWLTGATAGR